MIFLSTIVKHFVKYGAVGEPFRCTTVVELHFFVLHIEVYGRGFGHM